MKHCVKVQVKDDYYQVHAVDIEAANVFASLSFAGGALRVWIDGELKAGPINEMLQTEFSGALISAVV